MQQIKMKLRNLGVSVEQPDTIRMETDVQRDRTEVGRYRE